MKGLLRVVRYWLGPIDVLGRARRLRRMLLELNPDLVHAMRIPFEGMLAAEALRNTHLRLLISVWGNDFTLLARHHPFLGWMTRRAMVRTNALHADCRRDLDLARAWGFVGDRPSAVLPGGGGVQGDVFYPGPPSSSLLNMCGIPRRVPVILNPRGLRGYVRNDVFFRAIPLVLAQRPEAVFLGLGMAGSMRVEGWIRELGIDAAVRLLPPVSRERMADLFRLADVAVSPSEHDGTPNTLLEAMACGCFPIAGDIASIREWIEHGRNGLLCDPASPEALAGAILEALGDSELRRCAGQHNVELIAERAEYANVMAEAESLYRQVIDDAWNAEGGRW